MDTVVCGEHQELAKSSQLVGMRRRSTGRDIFDENCSGRCSITLPHLPAVDPVVRCKVEYAVDIHELAGVRAICPSNDIFDENRGCIAALCLPEFTAMDAVGS